MRPREFTCFETSAAASSAGRELPLAPVRRAAQVTLTMLTFVGALPSCSLLFDVPSGATPEVCEEAAGLFDAINTLGDVDDPSVSSNGMTLFFSHRPDNLGSLWRATRTEPCAPWSAPKKVDLLQEDVEDPTLGTRGNCLYYEFGGAGYSITASSDPGEPESLSVAPGLGGILGIERADGCATEFLVDRDSSIYVEGPEAESRILDLGISGRVDAPWLAPDLSSILFVLRSTGVSEIYTAEATGGELGFDSPRRLSTVGDFVSDPWLTSGLIYAVRGTPPNRHLIVLDALP